MSKKYIVTGGAGFIGSHLVERLVRDGDEVLVIDDMSSGDRGNLPKEAKLHVSSINDELLPRIFRMYKPHGVFHLAAQINVRKSVEEPIFDASTNIIGSLNVLKAAYESGAMKIVFSSSGGAAYGDTQTVPTPESCVEDPVCPYGISKIAFEKYLKRLAPLMGLDYAILRYSNVYGPKQSSKGEAGVVSIFTEKALSGGKMRIFGSGEQTRDFVFVSDVVEANILAMKHRECGTWNIGTSKSTSVLSVAKEVSKNAGVKLDVLFEESVPGEVLASALDISKAKSELGWSPKTSFKDGIRETVSWFKKAK